MKRKPFRIESTSAEMGVSETELIDREARVGGVGVDGLSVNVGEIKGVQLSRTRSDFPPFMTAGVTLLGSAKSGTPASA